MKVDLEPSSAILLMFEAGTVTASTIQFSFCCFYLASISTDLSIHGMIKVYNTILGLQYKRSVKFFLLLNCRMLNITIL